MFLHVSSNAGRIFKRPMPKMRPKATCQGRSAVVVGRDGRSVDREASGGDRSDVESVLIDRTRLDRMPNV